MEHRRVSVLAEDPDLGSGLEPSQLGLAQRRAAARVHLLARGPWAPPVAPGVDPQSTMGLLVIEGLLTREIQLAGRRSLELLGCGDVLRPWQPDNDEYAIVPSEAQWTVAEPARIAVLDRHFEQAVAGWPEIVSALMGRMAQRARSLTVRLAIAQIPQLSSRLLLVLWHLADRWGRVGQGGVALPLRLSHGMLAELVSAQRPSVSNALRTLREQGLVWRAPDGSWQLGGNPPPELERLSALGVGPEFAPT